MTKRRKFEVSARSAGKTERAREEVKKAIEDGKNVYLAEAPPTSDAVDGEQAPKQEGR